MTTKKPKRKVIDGVVKKTKKPAVKSKKPAKKPASTTPKKNIPVEDAIVKKSNNPEGQSIVVAAKDTTITVIDADDTEDKTNKSNIDNVDNDGIATDAVDATDTKDAANTADIKDAIDDAETIDTIDTIEDSLEENPILDNLTDDENGNDSTVAESTIDDDALVSEAILEEDVIDRNLDDLINDIENDITEKNHESTKDHEPTEYQDSTKRPEIIKDPKAEAITAVIDEETFSSTNQPEESISPKKTKTKARTKAKVKGRPFRIISRLLALGTIAASTALIVRVATTGIIPNKYLIPGIAVIALFLLFYLFKSLRNKTRIPVLVILNLIGIALAAASIFCFIRIDETMSFLNKNFNDNNKEYSIYNIIVNKKSSYNSLDDVRRKTFHSISDFVDTAKLEAAVKEQANSTVAYADGITSLLKGALDSNTYIVLLNSGTYSSAIDGDNSESKTYNENLKIIGEIKVESEKQTSAASNSRLTEDSFTVYLSGIDTRSGLMLDRSLSDVNIVITVNPKTKNILMSTIPRDYYVQLHGTSGLPDKLTHAGSLGGVQLSMATIGDLLGINFDRYIRVNFNFVINLVNAIGGITVYSDVDYTFTSLHPENKKCTFHPGNNEVDGECALGFARERYAYSDGDRHRGRNQEQVIEKIFEKVTSSSTLISKYSSILDALSGSFDTNISTNDITSLANMQLSDMAKWTINTYNLDGTGGMAYTYSYPSQQLYVMYPDQTTVDTAKQKIQAVLNGNNNTGSLSEPAAE